MTQSAQVGREAARSVPQLGRVLMVDDESSLLRALTKITSDIGYAVESFDHPEAALSRAREAAFDVALLDIKMPAMSGLELLKHLKTVQPDLEVIMMTAHGTVQDAFHAVKLGAFNFLRKPFDNAKEALTLALQQAVERRRLRDRNRALESQLGTEDDLEIIGRSAVMRPVFEMIAAAAPSQSTILVLGETGVGKDLVARAIHARSRRAERPLLSLNCGAVVETMLASELFGNKARTATGVDARPGLFVAANRGTLFLDEIGDMPMSMQTALLRTLETGEVKMVGAETVTQTDVRIIAATHVDLDKAVAEGRFRADLLNRLNVFTIRVPPLRERLEDVPLIAYAFMRRFATREKKDIRSISPELVELLMEYQWPDNVRKLRNVIESAVVMCQTDELTVADCRHSALGEVIRQRVPAPAMRASGAPRADAALYGLPFADAKVRAVTAFERDYMAHVMEAAGHNLTRAAQLAVMDRANFRRVLRRCGLRATEEESGETLP